MMSQCAGSKMLRILILLTIALLWPKAGYAQNPNPYPECPPNNDTIWVYREEHHTSIPHAIEVPFDSGQIYDAWDGRLINNYLLGVLEYEIAGTPETQASEWKPETGKAMAVAARTVAYAWCGEQNIPGLGGHKGVNDHGRQHYNPGHSDSFPALQTLYQQAADNTADQYLVYNGQIIDINSMRYNNYTGTPTQNLQSGGPLKGVPDPVASSDEQENPGMGQHSANHWFTGQHNADGCDSSSQCLNPSPSHTWTWADNVRWMDHRQALAHYYTDIHISDANAGNAILTPDRRWNALKIENLPIAPVSPGSSHSFDFWLQNTGVDDWGSGYYALSYQICQYGVCNINTTGYYRQPLNTTISPGDDTGENSPVSINVFFPSNLHQGPVTVRFDMTKLSSYWGSVESWFSTGNWPTQNVSLCVDTCAIHIPAVEKRFGAK